MTALPAASPPLLVVFPRLPPRALANGGQVESPALLPRNGREALPAYEMKFLLDEHQAREVERLVAGELALDPHGDPALGGCYRITTLYCDTPEFHVFHRAGSHRFRRHRLRRYGTEGRVFLERKTRRGEQVRKRRDAVAAGELALLSGFSAPPAWSGAWFHEQLLRRRLHPVCRVEYRRRALVGATPDGPARLTFDRELQATASSDWSLEGPAGRGRPLLVERVVCEFKFQGALPALFKSVIGKLQLAPCGVSKYRLAALASGAIRQEGGRADA